MAPSPFPADVPLNVKKAVLYGLLGFAGDVIVADATGFRLHDAVLVQPAERMVIDTLVQSGHALRSLEAFVQQDGSHWQAFQRAARGQASLYLVRVCDGLREVLGAYRRAVADLDWELDQNPVLPVAYFQSRLGEHLMLLGELGALCSRVMQSQLQGAPLLNELRARTQSGVPVVRGIMTRLLRYGFDLMVQHIAFWMLYGVLPDSHGEFFIVRRRPPGEDPLPQGDDDEVDASGDHTGVFEEYQLDQSLVPDVLLERSEYHKVPAAILFVGKATRILQVAERRAAHRSLTGDASGRLTVHGPTEEEREGMLAELEAANGDTFDVHRLQVAVHGIHGRVGRHLWTLLTEETRLSEHLRALRDYFLCCRGDFFAPFLELSADVLLVDIRRDEAAFQLQQHWHTACLLSSADDDECFDRITLRWQPTAQGPLAADSTWALFFFES
jgi:gamma-tubulin complex component 4